MHPHSKAEFGPRDSRGSHRSRTIHAIEGNWGRLKGKEIAMATKDDGLSRRVFFHYTSSAVSLAPPHPHSDQPSQHPCVSRRSQRGRPTRQRQYYIGKSEGFRRADNMRRPHPCPGQNHPVATQAPDARSARHQGHCGVPHQRVHPGGAHAESAQLTCIRLKPRPSINMQRSS